MNRLASAADRLRRAPLGAPLRRGLDRMVRGRPVAVRVRAGVARGARLRLDLSREKAYWLGIYEPELQSFLANYVRPGQVVYDVGAHHGFISVCAAKLGATVFAFEPVPENAALCRENARLNPGLSITVVEAAVSANSEPVRLLAGPAGDSNYVIAPGGTVPSVTLDEFATANPQPALVKIDVEGSEADVLRGANRLLREQRPLIVCDLHGEDLRSIVSGLLGDYDVEPLESQWRLIARPRPTQG